jgi:hypothetical protein
VSSTCWVHCITSLIPDDNRCVPVAGARGQGYLATGCHVVLSNGRPHMAGQLCRGPLPSCPGRCHQVKVNHSRHDRNIISLWRGNSIFLRLMLILFAVLRGAKRFIRVPCLTCSLCPTISSQSYLFFRTSSSFLLYLLKVCIRDMDRHFRIIIRDAVPKPTFVCPMCPSKGQM